MFRFGRRYSDDLRKKENKRYRQDDRYDDEQYTDDDRYDEKYTDDDRYDDEKYTDDDRDDDYHNIDDDHFAETRDMTRDGAEECADDSFDDTREMDTYESDEDDDRTYDESFDDTCNMNNAWTDEDDDFEAARDNSRVNTRRHSGNNERKEAKESAHKENRKSERERISAFKSDRDWDDEIDNSIDDVRYDDTYNDTKTVGSDADENLRDDRDYYEEDYEDDYEDTYWGDEPRSYQHGREKSSHGGHTGKLPVAAFFAELLYKIKHMSGMDRIVMVTGAFVLVVAILTISIFTNAKMVEKQVSEFQSVGENLEGVTVVGQSGLIAVSDAESARLSEMTDASEESTEESTEESSAAAIAVRMKATSIKSDLKLKFINRESGNLVSDVQFKAKASGPEDIELVDDDKDGIIYKKDVKAGTYKIVLEELPDDVKDKYTFSQDTTECTVSDQIEYKKVDVKDEVKTENQVNAAKEDTKTTGDTPVESQLTDTVEWVESSKVGADGSSADGYVEVNKSDVSDPGNVSQVVFYRAVQESSSTNTSSAADQSSAVTPSEQAGTSSNPAATSSDGTSAGTSAGTSIGTSTGTSSSATTDTTTTTSTTKTGQKLSLSPSSANLIKGKTVVITPTVEGATDTTVNWTVSDSKIASISATATTSGANITVTAIGAGTAVVTATLKENSAVSVKFNVTVTAVDPTTKLKDKSGNQLYIIVDGKYVEATYADYAKYDKFYRKSGNSNWIYTGWQTIDGATYFFTKDHNFVTGEQVIQGVKYTFGSDGHLQAGSGKLGIDVSKWNGAIDWNAVRNSGVSYVIIRCGYRGKSGGSLIQDPRFSANVKGARAAGLSVGLYFFSQAVSDVEAVEEASMAVNMASGCGVSLPIYIDVEGSGGRGDAIDTGTRTAVCKAFCATVRNSGYAAGVYSNKSWLTSRVNTGSLTAYKIWLAQYAAQPTYTATRYDMWQYSSKGRVAGINGNVDMNLRFD